VFYVKDTIYLVMFNLEDKSTRLIGQTKDAILSMNVNTMTLRQKDLEHLLETNQERNQQMVDLEKGSSKEEESFRVVCLDESQNIYVFSILRRESDGVQE
jgi:hypothetical protein